MALIGMGNNKLICFLIHLEKTDPERYNAIKRKKHMDILKSMQLILHI